MFLINSNNLLLAEEIQLGSKDTETVKASAVLATDTPINQVFPDPVLAQTVAGLLSKTVTDTVTQDDLDEIVEISIINTGMKSLEGMQYLSNLSILTLIKNPISDLTPLANLTDIIYLSMAFTNVTDLTPLSNLTNLDTLIVTHSSVSDLTPLVNLTKLTYLDLGYNEITDLRPLKGATAPGLYHLGLGNQTIRYPVVPLGEPIIVENVVKDLNGQLIVPNTISDSGSYNGPYVQWSGLTNQTSTNFTFEHNGMIDGDSLVTFSGTITQPLLSADDVTYEKGISKTDAAFLVDAEVSSEADIMITSDFASKVDLNTLGTYTVTITGEDPKGNKASVQVDVTVEDTTAPTITARDVTYERGISKTEAAYLIDAKVMSEVDATITSDFASSVDLNKVGVYTVIITAEDASGNKGSTQVKVTVEDTIAPVVTAEDVTYEKGNSKTEVEYLIDAKVMSEADATITTDFSSKVDLNTPGTYLVTITAIDMENNQTSLQVNVHVKEVVHPVKPDPEKPGQPNPEVQKPGAPKPPVTVEPMPRTGENGISSLFALFCFCTGLGVITINRKSKASL